MAAATFGHSFSRRENLRLVFELSCLVDSPSFLACLNSHTGVRSARWRGWLVDEPSLHQVGFDWTGFQWIDFSDGEQSAIAFMRKATDPANFVICVCNFTPVPRHGYRIGVPAPSWYRELLNSDAAIYGGSNVGNWGGVQAEPTPWHGLPYSLPLTLPPLAVLFLKPS